MSAILNPERLQTIFFDCFFRDGEPRDPHVIAEGIVVSVGLHPGRLAEHKAEIAEMLGELPNEFMHEGGGGWSFLHAAQDKHGELWTGEHRSAEQLMLLGLATGLVELLVPREMWHTLPGGVPYYVVKLPAAPSTPA